MGIRSVEADETPGGEDMNEEVEWVCPEGKEVNQKSNYHGSGNGVEGRNL